MAKQIVAILCEGVHDVAFIAKVLKAADFNNIDKNKIGDFPFPINDLLKSEVSKSKIEDLNLQEVREALVPNTVFNKDDTFLFVYSVGGDKKAATRQKLLRDFFSFIPNEGEYTQLEKGSQFAIFYILDADSKGIKVRKQEIYHELSTVFGSENFNIESNIHVVNKLKIGYLIFTGEDANTGKLEDILIPIMKAGNEKIFEDANSFLTTHYDVKRGKKNDYDVQKSSINIAGQLQKSGSSNVVCINQTDYITNEKINSHPKCLEIIQCINDFLIYIV